MADDIWWDLIRHIQDQIAQGTYYNRKKLAIVAERLEDELTGAETSRRNLPSDLDLTPQDREDVT